MEVVSDLRRRAEQLYQRVLAQAGDAQRGLHIELLGFGE
jgi:hypothetical protein